MNTTPWQRENAPTGHIGPQNKATLSITCQHVWPFSKPQLNADKRIIYWHRSFTFPAIISMGQMLITKKYSKNYCAFKLFIINKISELYYNELEYMHHIQII